MCDLKRLHRSTLIYSGAEAQRRSEYDVVPYTEIRRWLGGE